MAPESEILKRKRSRPSDWWTVAPTTPLEPAPAAKKRGRPSGESSQRERVIRDALESGNRGKRDVAKGKGGVMNGGDENPDELGESSKPVGVSQVERPKKGKGRIESQANAEQASTPKKRGRPAAARPEEHENKGKPVKMSTPSRRGRSSNTEAGLRAAVKVSTQEDDMPKTNDKGSRESKATTTVKSQDQSDVGKKRGHRPALEREADPTPRGFPEVSMKKKRSRISEADVISAEASLLVLRSDDERGRTRTRRSDAHTVAGSSQTDEQTRGMGRTRALDRHIASSIPSSSNTGHQEKGKKRVHQADTQAEDTRLAGRPKRKREANQQDHDVDVETASSNLRRDRSGPKKSVKASKIVDVTGTKRSSKAQETQVQPRLSKRKETDQSDHEPPKKRRVSQKPKDDTPEPQEEPIYQQYLTAVSRRVSRQTIETKWEPLPPNCVERISQLLQDAQRPVVVRHRNERRKTQASTALQMISRRLVNKISKGLPFPLGTRGHREDDFDFEKVLDHNQAAEAQLTPALHANKLLEDEVRKEMVWLQSEKEKLAELEANAKREAGIRSQAARKLHSLLQSADLSLEIEELKEDIGFDSNAQATSLDIMTQEDDNLLALSKELGGHVESIQGNIKQVEGISQAISRSKAAVQDTLFNHLDSLQYNDVILGPD